MTEWVPRGQTDNQHYDLQVLTTLGERVRSNGLNCGKTTLGSCIKIAMCWFIMPYLLRSIWPKIERQCLTSPYSPDFAPRDIFRVG